MSRDSSEVLTFKAMREGKFAFIFGVITSSVILLVDMMICMPTA